jgi:hypothetical protein
MKAPRRGRQRRPTRTSGCPGRRECYASVKGRQSSWGPAGPSGVQGVAAAAQQGDVRLEGGSLTAVLKRVAKTIKVLVAEVPQTLTSGAG